MTTEDFRYALQRGLGRCVIELQQTGKKEMYKDLVLWACTHNTSYDAQCEGTRSRYLYELIRCYSDTGPFLSAIIRQFSQMLTSDDGWEFDRCCELLGLFAADGNDNASSVLESGYKIIYGLLHNVRDRDDIGPELSNFETVSINIVNYKSAQDACADSPEQKISTIWEESFCAVIEDIGSLLSENSILDVLDFDWFQLSWELELGEMTVREILKERAGKSTFIKFYTDAYGSKKVNNKDSQKGHVKSMDADTLYSALINGGRLGVDIPVMAVKSMIDKGKDTEVRKLAQYYTREESEDIRSCLLYMMRIRECAGYLDVCSVINDAASNNEELKNSAFDVLVHIKNQKVHDFALSIMDNDDCTGYVISMLAHNYNEDDYGQFVKLLHDLPISMEDDGWHGAFMSILEIFEEDEPHNLPAEILPYMYSVTLCSCCRAGILKEMERQGVLTDEVLQECLHDSNEDIREYAGKLILNTKEDI